MNKLASFLQALLRRDVIWVHTVVERKPPVLQPTPLPPVEDDYSATVYWWQGYRIAAVLWSVIGFALGVLLAPYFTPN